MRNISTVLLLAPGALYPHKSSLQLNQNLFHKLFYTVFFPCPLVPPLKNFMSSKPDFQLENGKSESGRKYNKIKSKSKFRTKPRVQAGPSFGLGAGAWAWSWNWFEYTYKHKYKYKYKHRSETAFEETTPLTQRSYNGPQATRDHRTLFMWTG